MSRPFLPRSIDLSRLSESEVGYLAGIMDGEGCISRDPGRASFRLIVATTTPSLLDWLTVKVGGKTRSLIVRSRNHNQGYVWTLQKSADVLHVLDYLWPHLVIKKSKAEQAILELTNRGIR